MWTPRATWRRRSWNCPGRVSIFRVSQWKLPGNGNLFQHERMSRPSGNGSYSSLSAGRRRGSLRRPQSIRLGNFVRRDCPAHGTGYSKTKRRSRIDVVDKISFNGERLVALSGSICLYGPPRVDRTEQGNEFRI